jgi:hypothetical protein
MSRPKKSSDEKSVQPRLNMKQWAYDKIDEAAMARGQTFSDYVVDIVMRYGLSNSDDDHEIAEELKMMRVDLAYQRAKHSKSKPKDSQGYVIPAGFKLMVIDNIRTEIGCDDIEAMRLLAKYIELTRYG